jgi:hypothetical protein
LRIGSREVLEHGDLDFDGDVDLNDLGSRATYFGTSFSVACDEPLSVFHKSWQGLVLDRF